MISKCKRAACYSETVNPSYCSDSCRILDPVEQKSEYLTDCILKLRIDKNEYNKCIIDLSNTIGEMGIKNTDLEDENLRLSQLLKLVWDVNKPDLDEFVRGAIKKYYKDRYDEALRNIKPEDMHDYGLTKEEKAQLTTSAEFMEMIKEPTQAKERIMSEEKTTKIKITLPENAKYNLGITQSHIFSDSNNSADWHEFRELLPMGDWIIFKHERGSTEVILSGVRR